MFSRCADAQSAALGATRCAPHAGKRFGLGAARRPRCAPLGPGGTPAGGAPARTAANRRQDRTRAGRAFRPQAAPRAPHYSSQAAPGGPRLSGGAGQGAERGRGGSGRQPSRAARSAGSPARRAGRPAGPRGGHGARPAGQPGGRGEAGDAVVRAAGPGAAAMLRRSLSRLVSAGPGPGGGSSASPRVSVALPEGLRAPCCWAALVILEPRLRALLVLRGSTRRWLCSESRNLFFLRIFFLINTPASPVIIIKKLIQRDFPGAGRTHQPRAASSRMEIASSCQHAQHCSSQCFLSPRNTLKTCPVPHKLLWRFPCDLMAWTGLCNYSLFPVPQQA